MDIDKFEKLVHRESLAEWAKRKHRQEERKRIQKMMLSAKNTMSISELIKFYKCNINKKRDGL